MKSFDWIIVGAGITGAALSYELTKQGLSVLLIDQASVPQNATRFSYGGIAYWSGTTELTRQICAEGITIYRSLSDELEGQTEFRELDLVLTISAETDPEAIAQSYLPFAIPPQLLSVEEACEREPLLNPGAIAGALSVRHGHINAYGTAQAYIQAFQRLGGTLQVGQITDLLRGEQLAVTGVVCGQETYQGQNVVMCAGALTRSLLKAMGIPVRIYFTHAEIIETPPVEIQLRSLVMPAVNQRFRLEADASTSAIDPLWDEPGSEPVPPILDVGAIQFLDGCLRIGQVSRTLTDPQATVDGGVSEAWLRGEVGKVLPALKDLPGTWHHCLIGFSSDKLPLIGAIPGVTGIHVFSGFSNPLALVPALARRFAVSAATGQPDEWLAQLSPGRFAA